MERKVNEAQDLAVIGKIRKGGPKKGMKERKVNEAQDLAVIGKMRKGGPKKGVKEYSCYSNHYRKDLRRDMFQVPQKGHFASKCPQNKVEKHK